MFYKSPELATNYKSTFLSSEKDQEIIWNKLLFQSRPYSDKLKKLLIIEEPDCLDETQHQYNKVIEGFSIKDLIDKQYIRIVPRFDFEEHEEMKSSILLEFDSFMPTENPEYRNCMLSFTIICHVDCWQLNDYKLRPHQIAGYVDGILNRTKLSGIGTLQFLGAQQVMVSEHFGGIVLEYIATHGKGDDSINLNPAWPAPQDSSL